MRTIWWLTPIAFLSGAAHADQAPPPFARADIERRTAHMFDLTDRNHDGRMSKAEYIAAAVAIAKARGLDKPTEKGLALVGAQFDAMDTKHEGAISRGDFIGEKMARFDAMDLNHDGIVSPDESHKAALALQRDVDAQKRALKAQRKAAKDRAR
jgi:Ca2+-binding EF-hand superfamily protein